MTATRYPAAGKTTPQSFAVVDAWPNTPQFYTSPIAGDPDTAQSEQVGNIQQLITGFAMPKSGIISEIGCIAQGGAGAGASTDVTASIVALARDSSAVTGLKIAAVPYSVSTTMLDNLVSATKVVLASGISVAVPAQFGITFKQPAGGQVFMQAMKSAGPIPGMVSAMNAASLIATPAYTCETTQLNGTDQPIVGDKVTIANFKGCAFYIKWQGE